MNEPTPGEITCLLKDWQNPETLPKVINMVYEDLRRIAYAYFKKHSNHDTLQPTALLHEAYLHILNSPDMRFESRRHFVNSAALIMRQLLAKYARGKKVLKRGGTSQEITLEEGLFGQAMPDPAQLLALEQALAKLEKLDTRKFQIVQMRLYLGLSVDEVAQTLETTDRTVRRDWKFIRTWLAKEMA